LAPKVCSPPMPRRIRRPATMSVASEVRSDVRERSSCWRRRPDEHGGGDQREQAELPRHGQHDEGDRQVGDELADRAGQDLGERAELVGVAGGHAEHLAGRRAPGQHVPHLHDLARDHLERAVEADQPGAHHQRVRDDPEHRADRDHPEQQRRPAEQRGGRAAHDAVVDGPAEDPRAERHRQEPQRVAQRGQRDQRLLLAEHPPQERGRGPGVGVRGGGGV
jgi:hypothetical protein